MIDTPRRSRHTLGSVDVITSTANPHVKAARKLARRQARERAGAFLVEGPRVLAEALPFLRQVFVDQTAGPHARALAERARGRGIDVLEVTGDVLASLAGTVTPQGLVGVAALPAPELDAVLAGADLVIALDRVGDPGNAGTTVRSADAAGADAVVLTAGSVDPRNPKAVRASAGSLFHLPVVEQVAPDALLSAARAQGLAVVAAEAEGEVAHDELDLARPTLLVFGSEAHGLAPALRDGADVRARVPMAGSDRPGYGGRAESLNLAATVAVVAFEAARQRRQGGRR